MIKQVQRKILEENIDRLIIVTPIGQTEPWVCTIFRMLVQPLLLLPQLKSFQKNPQGKNHPEVPSLSRKNTKSKGKNWFIWDILMSLTLGVNDKQTNEPKFLIYSLSSIRLYISFLHFSTFKIQFHGVRIFTFCSGL